MDEDYSRKEIAMITERQIEIINILHNAECYITQNEIAEKLKVSVKTVRNDLCFVKELIAQNEVGIVMTKPHFGVLLIPNDFEWERFHKDINSEKVSLIKDMDVLYSLIFALLKKKTECISAFERRLYISRTVMDRNINIAKLWFEENKLLLDKNKRGLLNLKGTEYNFRMALLKFFEEFAEQIKQERDSSSIMHSIPKDEYQVMREIFDGFDIVGIMDIVHSLEDKYGVKYNYQSSIRSVFLISIGVISMRKKIYINDFPVIVYKVDGNFDDFLLHDLVACIEERYNLKIPDCENNYLRHILGISEIQEFSSDQGKELYMNSNIELFKFTSMIIAKVSQICNVDLRKDSLLLENLFLELKPMIGRTKFQLTFKNPILRRIKKGYLNNHAVVWVLNDIFENELGIILDEDEAGTLELHLNGAIERCTTYLKASIVCNYGVGISYLLKEKIEKKIRKIKITNILSIRDLRTKKNVECDFIISTIPIEESSCNKDVVMVDSMLNQADIRNIENLMKHIDKNRLIHAVGCLDFEKRESIFNKDFIHLNLQVSSKEELLGILCEQLKVKRRVTEGFETSVFERESKNSTEIGRRIALPHGYSKFINHSTVSVAILDKPIKWINDEVDLVFLVAFDLEESAWIKGQIMKFYKAFSIFSEENQAIEDFKRITRTEDIVNFLNNM